MSTAEFRPAIQLAAAVCYFSSPFTSVDRLRRPSSFLRFTTSFPVSSYAVSSSSPPSTAPVASKTVGADKKPAVCTADELHYVPVPGTEWRLALWRYLPSPKTPPRNHPLMLLSGVGTNAIGYDLSPECSFARYMANQGFDTWIVEVRGAGLSTRGDGSMEAEDDLNRDLTNKMIESVEQGSVDGAISNKPSPNNIDTELQVPDSTAIVNNEDQQTSLTWDESQLVLKLTDALTGLTERLSEFLNEGQLRAMLANFTDQIYQILDDAHLSDRYNEIRERIAGLLESGQNLAVLMQIKDLSQRIFSIVEEGQKTVSPQFLSLPDRLYTTVDDFQKQLDLIVKYNWDFDNYLEEDIPAAMKYIMELTKPKDGKLLSIGHSMGGILLYAILSRYASVGGDSKFAAVVTLASSLDYTPSRSSLKLLLPLADPAQALNVPVVPMGVLMSAAYPLARRPPYVLSWLNAQVSAQDMMLPEMFERLVLNNFCTIPAKLLLQLASVFRDGGLRDRSGSFCYKDHIHKIHVPVLALAGDQDLICPPEAVYETVKILPQHLVTYKVFGKADGPHYGHYDLVGGRLMADEVFPCILEFLIHHDAK